MAKISNKQITDRGIAQQSGLEVFSNITNYTGEYINYTTGLEFSLDTASAYSTTAANPFTDSLINNPPSTVNAWYKFFTGGAPYAATTTPLALGSFGAFFFYSNTTVSLTSYSGIYQKLSLVKGNNYNIYIDRIGADPANASLVGDLQIQVYTPESGDYVLIFDNKVSVPMGSTGSQTFGAGEFTAQSANDIFLIYYTSKYVGAGSAGIRKISIKKKEEYLVPVYASDSRDNAHKVLKRNLI